VGQLLNWILIGCTVLGLVLGGACTNGSASQPQGNAPDNSAAAPAETLPVSPLEPLPPPSLPPVPEQDNQPPSQPAPGSNLPAGDSLDATALVTRQASQMTLTLEDMGPGWTQGIAIGPAKQLVTSSSHVYYTQGSSYAPGVQNTVAVYRSLSGAEEAYAREKQTNISTSNPGIGDECLLNDSVPINKLLIFRKNNVVVWLWLSQYKEGDIERYARMVEKKITAQPITPAQSSQTVTTPSQQTPVEPSAGIQPAIIKPANGIVTKQAYEMVLTQEDMGPGWMKGNVSPPANRKSTSTSQVLYSQGTSFAPTVQNSVIVYRDIQAAMDAYAGAKPTGAYLVYPGIGAECFLNDSVMIDRVLVFRKDNVVVWVWLKQYKTGDIESYARIVEKKITF